MPALAGTFSFPLPIETKKPGRPPAGYDPNGGERMRAALPRAFRFRLLSGGDGLFTRHRCRLAQIGDDLLEADHVGIAQVDVDEIGLVRRR